MLLTTPDGQKVIGMCLTQHKLKALSLWISLNREYTIKTIWTDGADLIKDGANCYIRFEMCGEISLF